MKKFFTCLLFMLFLFGCSNKEFDYREEFNCVDLIDVATIHISPDIMLVSEADIEKAIEMYIQINEVLVEKEGTVEKGDIVSLKLNKNNEIFLCEGIVVGDNEFFQNEENLVGLSVGECTEIMDSGEIFEISIVSILNYPNEITDSIVKKYTVYNNVQEFKSYVKDTICENRLKEEVYGQFLNGSALTKEPSGIDAYVEWMMSLCQKMAEEVNLSIHEYILEFYGKTIEEYKIDIKNLYYEMLIVNSFSWKIGMYPTDTQIREIVFLQENGEKVDADQLEELYGEEYLAYCYNYEKVLEYLLANISLE